MEITINVKNKIASNVNNTALICGNTNYRLNFILDSEWNGKLDNTYVYYTIDSESQEALPLRQDTNGYYIVLPAISTGNILLVGLRCIESNSTLYTTTSARIVLSKSIANYAYNTENPKSYHYVIDIEDGKLVLEKDTGAAEKQKIETLNYPIEFTIKNDGCLYYNSDYSCNNYILNIYVKTDDNQSITGQKIIVRNGSESESPIYKEYTLGSYPVFSIPVLNGFEYYITIDEKTGYTTPTTQSGTITSDTNITFTYMTPQAE